MRQFPLLALVIAVCLGLFEGKADAEELVDIELVLAVDVSRSMSPGELEIQRRGYAEALTSDEVLRAIMGGIYGQVALTYVEWAGTSSQRPIVAWTLIRNREDAVKVADRLTAVFDQSLRRTSISGAIDFAAGLFDDNGFRGLRRVIDISGDGPNNQGRTVTLARDEAVARGIIINGLPLMTRDGMGIQWHLEDLDVYYQECVIGGPGAFVVPVLEWRHFPAAVRRKLVLELAGHSPAPALRPSPILAAASGYDCLVGEKRWNSIMGDTDMR
ncbi:MAG TPA: DUF1194 domain-containing protein [Alphaproteobacteria bacterium]|nr:DUF1194 domain-containing protein [Alphaproteobacteria bacterium]